MSIPGDRLSAYDARHSERGLLLRYAGGRVRHFMGRQLLTCTGALSLIILVSLPVGLAVAALALAGDALDCLLLRQFPHLAARGVPVARLRRMSTISAGLQALTIAASVALGWWAIGSEAGAFFCLAYLTGGAINGGVVMPFHRSAALVRLAIYGATALGLFAHDVASMQGMTMTHALDMLAALMMAYMVWVFVGHVVAGHNRNQRDAQELLAGRSALERANADLHEQQREARKLSLVARHANDSVVISDPGARIIWVNDAFTRMTGYSLDEAAGRRPADLLNAPDTDPATSEAIGAAVRAGRPHRAEILNRTRDGRKIWVETNLVPVLSDAGAVEVVVAIERDVTQAREHAAALARATRSAEEASRAKAAFLATMSHEIRTPMNGIVGMSDLLCEAGLTGEPRLYADTIRDSANALLGIVNDILDLSRLDAGMMTISPRAFSLRDCVMGASDLLRTGAREKGLRLNLSIDTPLPPRMLGDDGRIRQILVNLIGNAVKFTETGSVTVEVRQDPVPGGHDVTIAVRDTGIGIDPASTETIFARFSQADPATTRRFGGTGLGLAISRLLARRMGGDITVRSAPGAGSVFTLRLRLGRAPAARPRPAGAPAAPKEPAPQLVLVAEDNRTNRLLIEKFLQHAPVRLIFAEDGHEAVAANERHRPDLIFMDMSMPGMDGLEATRLIRARGGAQPRIVALTANAFAADREACLAAGMDDFLSKPVRRAQLLAKLGMTVPPHPPPGPAAAAAPPGGAPPAPL